MQAEHTQQTIRLNGAAFSQWMLLSFLCLSVTASPMGAKESFNRLGIAFVDSLEPQVHYRFSSSDSSRPFKLHQSLSFDQPCEVSTGLQGHLFLKFSNHVSFGIMENTRLSIEHFRQASFKDLAINTIREPSKSSFKAHLKEGTILIKTDKFSALSTFQIEFPMGILEFYSAECVIEYRYNIIKIALYRGNISLTPKAEQAERRYLSAPSYFTSDHYDLKEGVISPKLSINKAPQQWADYPQFIRTVDQRIQFFPLPEGSETLAEAKILIEKTRFEPSKSKQIKQP